MTSPVETSRTLGADTVRAWADVVDDRNPLHLDAEFAAATRFGGPIVHGSLLFALTADAVQESAAEPLPATLTVRFRAPVPVGSNVTVRADAVQADGHRVRLWCDGAQPVEAELSHGGGTP